VTLEALIDSAIKGDLGALLTRAGGPLHHPNAEHAIAIYESGDWFVAKSHARDRNVLAVKHDAALLARRGISGIPTLRAQPNEVDMIAMNRLHSGAVTTTPNEERSEEEIQKLAFRIVADAHQRDATDVHIRIFHNSALIDYRIHGVLIATPQYELTASVANRVANALYNLNDLGGEGPQPHRFQSVRIPRHKAPLPTGTESLRATYVPIAYGGQAQGRYVAIRLAKLEAGADAATDLLALGYSPQHAADFDEILRRPDGITFIAGIMNSGKTKSLQVLANRLNLITNSEKRILTIEDPVEIHIPGAAQISLPQTKTPQERRDRYLEAAMYDLRSDSNVTIYGEIRDPIVVEQAFDTVLRGNPVFGTIHAKRATAILKRLKNWGVGTWLYADPENIIGLAAQRLLPVLCQACAHPLAQSTHTHELRRRLDATGIDLSHARGRNKRGCARCAAGYTGRTLAAEVLLPDEQYMRFVAADQFDRADAYWIDECSGRPMIHHALTKVSHGLIDPDDVETRIERIDPNRIAPLFAGGHPAFAAATAAE